MEIKKTLKNALKSAALACSNIHTQAGKKNVFLFSTPRSGSTWLMEVIASQPGFKFYDEPLNIRRENVQKTGMFKDWDALLPGTRNEEYIIDYLKGLESNRFRCMNSLPFRRNHRFLTNRIIFKIHELEDIINIVKERMGVQIVYLVRHPVATTVSRQVLPRLESFVKSEAFAGKYLSSAQMGEIRKIYSKGTDFEKGILSWCYQNLVSLNFSSHDGWLVVSYEELLLNPYKSCELLYERLDLDDKAALYKSIGLPSTNIALSTAETINIMKTSDEEERKRKLVIKWKQKVSEKDERSAFEILAIFGIDAYSAGRFVASDKYLHFSDTGTLV